MVNRQPSGKGAMTILLPCGQWLTAPHGVPHFDDNKDDPRPRPVVVLNSYGGFLRVLGRSTKPNDDPTNKLEHTPHSGSCELGQSCRINEPGYVSIRKRDIWTPLSSQITLIPSCFEPDDAFVETLFDLKQRLT